MKSSPSVTTYILTFFTFIAFIIAFWPSFKLLNTKWLASDEYSHAFFIVPLIIYMLWDGRRTIFEYKSFSNLGLFFLVCFIAVYLLSLQLQIPTLIFLSTALTIVCGILFMGGWQSVKSYCIPILLMFLIIPIPDQVLVILTGTLQLKISALSEVIIRSLGIPMLREGNVLHMPDISFQVVEACSGIRSLISLTTLSILIGYFSHSKIWSITLLFFLSIPVAIFINLLRVVTLVLVYHYFHLDLSKGTLHTVTGLILFILGFVILFSFQNILSLWQRPKQHS